eukprot:6461538-Pyramimonas_sp.AAC.1
MPPTVAWNDALTPDSSSSMIAGCGLSGTNVDPSVRKYADDLTKTHLWHDAKLAAYKVQRSDQVLNDKLSTNGLQQNAGKKAVLPSFVGTGAHRSPRALHCGNVPIDGEVHSSTLFLGSTMQANGHNHVEMNARCVAAARGWRTMGRFWYNCRYLGRRKIVFRSQVLSAATSGLEARVLIQAQLAQIDACVARYARALLRGTAYTKQHTDIEDPFGTIEVGRTIPTIAVWKKLKM